MRDLSEDLAALRRRLEEAAAYLDIATTRKRLAELEPELVRPDLWDDPERAQATTREYAALKDDVELQDGLGARLADAELLYQMAEEEADDSVAGELEAAIAGLGLAVHLGLDAYG